MGRCSHAAPGVCPGAGPLTRTKTKRSPSSPSTLPDSRCALTLTLLGDAELLDQPFHDISACTGEAKWAETAAPCSPRVSTSLTRYRVGNDGDQKALAPHLHALVRVLHTDDHLLHLRASAGGGGGGNNSDLAQLPSGSPGHRAGITN